MKIIDAHVHIIERLAGYGAKGEARPIGKGRVRWASGEETQMVPPELGDFGFSAENMIEMMNTYGVEKAVVLQGSGYGFQNEYTAEVVKRFPNRFVGAATLDPCCVQAKKIFDRLIDDLKFRILKFELSESGGLGGYHKDLRIDGKEMEFIWEEASRRIMTVVLDIGGLDGNGAHIDSIKKILSRYKNVKIVIAHLLAPSLYKEKVFEEILPGLKNERVWFDIAALPWFTDPDPYPYKVAAQYVSSAKRIVGSDRIIWGSDVPVVLTRDSYLHLMDYLSGGKLFNDAELERIKYWNAREAYDF